MEDKTMLENILSLQKSLAMLYINGTIESSNPGVRKVFEEGLITSLDLQDEIYTTMKDNDMYQVSNIKASDIKTTYKKLNKDSE